MNKVQRGLAESVTGIVMGFVLMTVVTSFAQDGLIPRYFVWLFGLLFIVANLATLNSFRYFGFLYTLGWLFGSLLLRDLLSPIDFVFNIIGPIVILVIRIWFGIRDIRG